MPPKDKQKKAQEAAKQKAKAKIVEDKTFGLKNKNKSSKVQSYVQQLQKSAGTGPKTGLTPEELRKQKKKQEEEQAKELASLFAVAIKQPKLAPGVDPKSVVCEFYRAGQCAKGFKCKYSHDLAVERKTQKIDLFSDRRGGPDGEEEEEGMEDWDQEKLESVVKQKHGADGGNSSAGQANNRTNIICKHFLEAVEKRQYGWFWQCPNGNKECKYRHALPPGYVLKSQMKELLEAEAANKPAVEDEIEEARKAVEARTPLTHDVFDKWRAEAAAAKAKGLAEAAAERAKKGQLTGREIFALEGFVAEDDAAASAAYEREVDDEEAIALVARAAAEAAAAASASAAGSSGGGGENGGGENGGGGGGGTATTAAAATPAAGATDTKGGSKGVTAAAAAAAADLFDDDDDDDEEEEDLEELEKRLAAGAKVSG